MHCKHCNGEIYGTTHHCPQKGLLRVEEDDSFLVSAAIGALTDSSILGAVLGGDPIGAIAGDIIFDGDLFD